MRSRKVWRYYCDHCSRGHWKKQDCAEHEARCYLNPKTKSCATCKAYLPPEDEDHPYCGFFEKALFTLNTASIYLDGEIGNDEMFFRTECRNWIAGTKEEITNDEES